MLHPEVPAVYKWGDLPVELLSGSKMEGIGYSGRQGSGPTRYVGALRTGAVRFPGSPLCTRYLGIPCPFPHPLAADQSSLLWGNWTGMMLEAGMADWKQKDVGSSHRWLKTAAEFMLGPPCWPPALSQRPAASPVAAPAVDWRILGKSVGSREKWPQILKCVNPLVESSALSLPHNLEVCQLIIPLHIYRYSNLLLLLY